MRHLLPLAALALLLLPTTTHAKPGRLSDADLAMAWADADNRRASSFSEQLVVRLRLGDEGDGYIRLLVTNVANANGRAEVKFGVTLPDGRKVRHKERKKRGDWSYGTERFDATVGAARFVAGTSEARIDVDGDGFEARIAFDLRHGPLRPEGGAADFGRGRHYRTTVFAVRAGVSGKVTFDDGEEVPLDGVAFMVHRAGNVAPYEMAKRWYNLLDQGPDASTVLSAFEEPGDQGGAVHAWMYAASDERLLVDQPEVALRPDRITKDESSPYAVPHVLHLSGAGGMKGVIKAERFQQRKDDLKSLSRVERFVVERLMKPWTYRFRASYLVKTSGDPVRGTGRYSYQQLNP